MLDVEKIRSDFPIFERRDHGQPIAYLDSAATSQRPTPVLDAITEHYRRRNANVHRGVYALSEEATAEFERARELVASFIHAASPEEVIFVRGTTEALNVVANGLGRAWLEPGDQVLSTMLEHHSNIVPWYMLKEWAGTLLEFVDIDAEGRLRWEEYDRLLGERTRVVAVAHVSNVLGTVNPVEEIAERAHDSGACVVVDAAQSVPHHAVDVQKIGADFVAFSGHKMLGPTGIGVLWGRREWLDRIPPLLGGGEMIREVHTDRVSFADPPAKFEGGTPNVAGAIGLGAAIEYLQSVGLDAIGEHESSLLAYAHERLRDAFGDRITLYGPPPGPDRDAIVSFSMRGLHPHDLASLLDRGGICVRSGHHCAQPLMERLGVPALTRASAYLYTTKAEIDRLVAGLEGAVTVLDRPVSATR